MTSRENEREGGREKLLCSALYVCEHTVHVYMWRILFIFLSLLQDEAQTAITDGKNTAAMKGGSVCFFWDAVQTH